MSIAKNKFKKTSNLFVHVTHTKKNSQEDVVFIIWLGDAYRLMLLHTSNSSIHSTINARNCKDYQNE